MDIRDYPGAIEAINRIVTTGREAEVRVENNDVAVAEHIRIFNGCYAEGESDKKRR